MIMEALPKTCAGLTDSEKRAALIKIVFEEPTRKKFLIEINRMVQNNGWALGYFTILDIFIY